MHCSKCQLEYAEQYRFCTRCGQKLDAAKPLASGVAQTDAALRPPDVDNVRPQAQAQVENARSEVQGQRQAENATSKVQGQLKSTPSAYHHPTASPPVLNVAPRVKKSKGTIMALSVLAACLALALILVSVFAFSSNSQGGGAKAKYFNSPEAAGEYFIKKIVEQDYAAALAAMDAEAFIRNCNQVAYLQAYGTIPPYDVPSLNPRSSEFSDLTRSQLQSQFAKQLVHSLRVLHIAKTSPYHPLVELKEISAPTSITDIEQMLSEINPTREQLKNLRFLKGKLIDINLLRISAFTRDTERYLAYDKQVCGFSDQAYYAFLLEYNSRYYLGAISINRYQEGWTVSSSLYNYNYLRLRMGLSPHDLWLEIPKEAQNRLLELDLQDLFNEN